MANFDSLSKGETLASSTVDLVENYELRLV
jgi:hypothetical protein